MEQQKTQTKHFVKKNISMKAYAQKYSCTENTSSSCSDSTSPVKLLPSAGGNLPPA